ncbi:MAG: leucine-rich repeat domain-containing protein [Chitinispirillaceae bacterium]|nr:leucine-rich repeat domain-containing protein [Chitinispirillaceae bacterium]
MYRKRFFLISFLVISAKLFAEQSDAPIVQSILEKCGLSGVTANDVAVMENGRVVTLNLTNKEVGKEGITVLPPEIGQLTALRELICIENSIETIPPEIGNCVNLKNLDLASNRIAAIPPEIGKLKNLTSLDLRHNSIEKMSPALGKCSNLEFLWLWGNKLTELDPAITQLKKLKELYLNDNRLTTLPAGIVGMKFKYIDLTGNKLCSMSTKLDAWAKKIDKEYRSMQKCQ